MRNVGLVYPDGRRALSDVSVTANVGQIVAFVGPTGAGKTSLAYLIPRFHTATEGEVVVDGHNVNDLTLDSLRSQVTYVFQETQLLSISIADNIRYGRTDASLAEVERVAKIAGVHDYSSPRCPRVTTPNSAVRPQASSPSARSSASPSPAACCATPRFSSLTSRRRP